LALDKTLAVRLRSDMRKRILIYTGLFLFGALIGFEVAWFLGFLRPSAAHESHAPPTTSAVELILSGTIDGSDRFIFTHTNVVNGHGQWAPPKDVMLNGVLWFDLAQPPEGWTEFAAPLDLTRASIVSREGRDTIALEPTANGFDLYFADTQMGAGPYSVTLRIPRK
jgi:hypothetical protein